MVARHSIIGSFYEASRKGNIVQIAGFERGLQIPAKKRIARPVFDFGHLNDSKHCDALSSDVYDELGNEWLAASPRIDFPYPICAYQFEYEETSEMWHCWNIMEISVEAEKFEIEIFQYQPDAPGDAKRWARHPIRLAFDADGLVADWLTDPDIMRNEEREHFLQAGQASFVTAITATLLLSRNAFTTDRPQDPGLLTINAGRARAALNPIQSPLVLRLDRERPNGRSIGTGQSVPRSPHDRRGHWRNLRSGKRVWIRDCAIAGGASTPREYRVR